LFSSKAPGDEPSPDESEQWEARLTEALKRAHDESIAPETWTSSLEEVRDCHVNLGHWEDAIAIEKKLLEVAPKETREQADCYHRLGSLELQMQHFAEARRYYHLALAIFYDIHGQDSFHRDMGKMLVGLGGICVHQGDSPELALPLLAQAEEHYRNHGMSVTTDTTIKPNSPHPEISVVLGNQALIHRMMGQHQVAIEKYKEMLVFLHQYESDNEEKRDDVQLQIADCLFAVNQLSPALDHFETLLENVKRRSRRGGGEDETETTATTAHEGVLRHHIGVIYSKQVRLEPTSASTEWRACRCCCCYCLSQSLTSFCCACTTRRAAWRMP
jgi:tetratricopeptide (TPR) repeat protein